jgi:hypothetical protein
MKRQSDAECERTGKRTCTKCGETKPLGDFYKRPATARPTGKYLQCKACLRAYARAWATAHPERRHKKQRQYYKKNAAKFRAHAREWQRNNPDRRKDSYLKRRFGITLVQFELMLADQDGACAGCRRPFSENLRAAVDHCHDTGVVRGLLCALCNHAVGLVHDDPETLQRLASYLKTPR